MACRQEDDACRGEIDEVAEDKVDIHNRSMVVALGHQEVAF